ncbi:hypothetical protein GIW81_15525 [Hyphomicrobium sp. xq]|uniref:Uncharacterized protein n=1 Tax=Hyphomicrobium album TaxID=2665159 RepID=A0A6I3KMS0_9HYPH|nr:hypothetical protein [Hyphomicrobium album]MTD95749.1 hypothetical protein [Hyphomicrobium album]
MKYIALIAVIAIILLQFSGAVPQSSVGGPMTLALVFFAAVLAVAIHEAWSNKRGVLGWIVNIAVSFVGAFVAAELGNLIFEPILLLFPVKGTLAASGHPLLYVLLAGMTLLSVLGSWIALQIVNRWR